MKIVILVLTFPPKWVGGTQTDAYNLAKYLSRRGHEVNVITMWDRGLPNKGMGEGFFINRIKTTEIFILRTFLYSIKSLFLIKKINPDIIHVQGCSIYGARGIIAVLAKLILKKSYVLWCQGSEVYLAGKLKRIASKLLLRNADAIIAVTRDMKNEIQRFHKFHVFVVPCGIDLSRFRNISKENLSNKQLKIRDNEKLIIFVGRLHPIKGVKYLVEAMNIIIQKTPAKLLIVGDGEERKNLEKQVVELHLEEFVTFVGKVQNSEVPNLMNASDIFVLPSLSEGLPTTILEAMAAGLPIITTNVRGLPEIVKDNENGFIIEPKNPKQIAEKVLLLLENQELRGRISRNNKEKINMYDFDSITCEMEKIYKLALEKSR
jgi:glycosyltransferase involved in cell wall biosynthesis